MLLTGGFGHVRQPGRFHSTVPPPKPARSTQVSFPRAQHTIALHLLGAGTDLSGAPLPPQSNAAVPEWRKPVSHRHDCQANRRGRRTSGCVSRIREMHPPTSICTSQDFITWTRRKTCSGRDCPTGLFHARLEGCAQRDGPDVLRDPLALLARVQQDVVCGGIPVRLKENPEAPGVRSTVS